MFVLRLQLHLSLQLPCSTPCKVLTLHTNIKKFTQGCKINHLNLKFKSIESMHFTLKCSSPGIDSDEPSDRARAFGFVIPVNLIQVVPFVPKGQIIASSCLQLTVFFSFQCKVRLR